MDINALSLEYDIVSSKNSEETLLNYIYESIDNANLNLFPLLESCGDLVSKYSVLIEAVDELHTIETEANELAKSESDTDEKKMGIIKKAITSIKNLFNWWYKEEPDKKFNTLRIILKISLQILNIIVVIWAPGRAAITKTLTRSKAGEAVGKIAYKGSKKIPKKLFSQSAILTTIVRVGYGQALKFINSIDNAAYEKINLNSIDHNIKSYDAAIDKINDMIEKTEAEPVKNELIATRKSLESSLAALIKIKEKRDMKIKKKEEKQNKKK